MASYIGNFTRQFLKGAAMAVAGAAAFAVSYSPAEAPGGKLVLFNPAYAQLPKPAFMETNTSRISLVSPDKTLKGLTEAIPGADQYELAFSGPVNGSVRTPCNGFSTQVPNVPEGEYSVKMRALQAGNPVSDYSDPATVTVTAEPSTRQLSTSKPAFYVRRQTLNPGEDAEIYWFPPDGRNDNIYALSIAFPDGTRIEPRVRCNGLKLRVPNSVPLGRYDLSIAALSGGAAGEFEGPYNAWLTDEREMIVFSRKVGNNFEIFRINPDGTNERQLTMMNKASGRPKISPDRKQIVFQSGVTGQSTTTRELYTMNSDGTNLRQLTNNLSRDFDPSFMPDGERIVFVSDRNGGSFDIYSMDIQTGQTVRLTRDNMIESSPVVSPNKKTMVYSVATRLDLADAKLYIMNIDNTGGTQLTNTPFADMNPTFDPTGRTVFWEKRDPGNIYKISLDGSQQTPITTFGNSEVALMPTISPDGRRLAVSLGSAGTTSDREIAVLDVFPLWITRITNNVVGDESPHWR